jgi:hypothetical protein
MFFMRYARSCFFRQGRDDNKDENYYLGSILNWKEQVSFLESQINKKGPELRQNNVSQPVLSQNNSKLN